MLKFYTSRWFVMYSTCTWQCEHRQCCSILLLVILLQDNMSFRGVSSLDGSGYFVSADGVVVVAAVAFVGAEPVAPALVRHRHPSADVRLVARGRHWSKQNKACTLLTAFSKNTNPFLTCPDEHEEQHWSSNSENFHGWHDVCVYYPSELLPLKQMLTLDSHALLSVGSVINSRQTE